MSSQQSEPDTLPDNAEPITRVRAMQAPLDRMIFHPLAARLAHWLSGTPATPNMVSIAGGAAVVCAGIAYNQSDMQSGWFLPVVAGFLIHLSWHILDGADGDLARMTGRASQFGEVVDGICDYAGHFILYCLLAHLAFASAGWTAPALALLAGFSRIVQASFYEGQRRQFLDWAYGVPWLRRSSGSDGADGRAGGIIIQAARRGYLGLLGWLAPGDSAIDAAAADPARNERLQIILRGMGPAALAGNGLLGATYRTAALGMSMLAGSPIYYFIYEAAILNIVLMRAVWQSRQSMAAVRGQI